MSNVEETWEELLMHTVRKLWYDLIVILILASSPHKLYAAFDQHPDSQLVMR